MIKKFLTSKLSTWLPIFLTILTLTVGTVAWAFMQHEDIRNWTLDRISDTEDDMKETMDKQYANVKDFSKVEQKIDDQIERTKEQDKKIERMDHKIDKILEKLTR